jgi:hypothetical protein
MLNIIFQSLLSLNCHALSWKCDYSIIDGPKSTHFLYKEDNVNIVKWLEKYEYCRAKGDTSIYIDAGKGKCEYSRNLCVFYNNQCILNENRENDPLQECQDLLNNNDLSYELDSGRIKQVTEEEVTEEEVQIEEEVTEEVTQIEEPVTENETQIEEVTQIEEPVTEIEEEPLPEIECQEEVTVTEEEVTVTEALVTEEEVTVTEALVTERMISAGKSNKISLLIFLLFIS